MPIKLKNLRRRWRSGNDLKDHEKVSDLIKTMKAAQKVYKEEKNQPKLAEDMQKYIDALEFLNQDSKKLCVVYNDEDVEKNKEEIAANEKQLESSLNTMNGLRDFLRQRNEDGITVYEDIIETGKKKKNIQSEVAVDSALTILDDIYDYKLDIKDVSTEYSKKQTAIRKEKEAEETYNNPNYQAVAYLLEDKDKGGEFYQAFDQFTKDMGEKKTELNAQYEKARKENADIKTKNMLYIDSKTMMQGNIIGRDLVGGLKTVSNEKNLVPKEKQAENLKKAAGAMESFISFLKKSANAVSRYFSGFAKLWEEKSKEFSTAKNSAYLTDVFGVQKEGGKSALEEVCEEQKQKYMVQKYLVDIKANSWEGYMEAIKGAKSMKGMEPEYLSRAMVAGMYQNSETAFDKEKLEAEAKKLRESPTFMQLAQEHPQHLGRLLDERKFLDAYAAVTCPITYKDPFDTHESGEPVLNSYISDEMFSNLQKLYTRNKVDDEPQNSVKAENWKELVQSLKDLNANANLTSEHPEKKQGIYEDQFQRVFNAAKDCFGYPKNKKQEVQDWNKSNEQVLSILAVIAETGPVAKAAAEGLLKQHNRRAAEYGFDPVKLEDFSPEKVLGNGASKQAGNTLESAKEELNYVRNNMMG